MELQLLSLLWTMQQDPEDVSSAFVLFASFIICVMILYTSYCYVMLAWCCIYAIAKDFLLIFVEARTWWSSDACFPFWFSRPVLRCQPAWPHGTCTALGSGQQHIGSNNHPIGIHWSLSTDKGFQIRGIHLLTALFITSYLIIFILQSMPYFYLQLFLWCFYCMSRLLIDYRWVAAFYFVN